MDFNNGQFLLWGCKDGCCEIDCSRQPFVRGLAWLPYLILSKPNERNEMENGRKTEERNRMILKKKKTK